MVTHSVSTTFNKNMSFTADINGHEVIMDTTADDGGDNSGPSPKKNDAGFAGRLHRY